MTDDFNSRFSQARAQAGSRGAELAPQFVRPAQEAALAAVKAGKYEASLWDTPIGKLSDAERNEFTGTLAKLLGDDFRVSVSFQSSGGKFGNTNTPYVRIMWGEERPRRYTGFDF